MEKSGGFGELGWHILLFILTFWTGRLLNAAYAAHAYFVGSKELHIKVEQQPESTTPTTP